MKYRLSSFVETGCYKGDGIAAALEAGLRTVRSCDISTEHGRHCRERFEGDGRVRIVEGESEAALAVILREELGPALFWLDAHYPALYGREELENEQTRYPVPRELAIIHRTRRGAAKDVILVDDLRVLEAADNPRWRSAENPEYFVVRGHTLASLTEAFRKSHEWRVDGDQEGILVITPR